MREPVRAGTDQHLARRGRLLQARREIDCLPGREGRLGVVGDDLARLDPDPGLQPELPHLLEDRERGADRAVGVVLVGERDAEGGHDGVAGELLDRPAVSRDAGRDLVEEAVDPPPDDLRIGAGDEVGRGDQVDE